MYNLHIKLLKIAHLVLSAKESSLSNFNNPHRLAILVLTRAVRLCLHIQAKSKAFNIKMYLTALEDLHNSWV